MKEYIKKLQTVGIFVTIIGIIGMLIGLLFWLLLMKNEIAGAIAIVIAAFFLAIGGAMLLAVKILK